MGKSLVSNPPYNLKWEIPALAGFMAQYAGWQIAPKQNANYAFIQTGLYLADDKAVFIMPMGCLSTSQKEEIEIKKQIIESNYLSAVISLPDSMFESTSIPVCLMVFDKHKETLNVEMIDMKKSCKSIIREQNGQFGGNSHTNRTYRKEINVLTEDAMQKAIEAIEKQQNITGFCKTVTIEDIRKDDYHLTPSRYINQEIETKMHRPFEDIANDYNRVISQKNAIKIKMNKTAAKRLGYECLNVNRPDLSQSFGIVGQKIIKEDFISFSANDGIVISISTKDDIHPLIREFLNTWRQWIMYLNTEENRYLAEFRDALLPELMSGKIDITESEEQK